MERQDESTLPKWAQRRLAMLRAEVKGLRAMQDASDILRDRDWFTVTTATARMTLHRLREDNAVAVCSLGPGDVLLIGRALNGGG